MSELGMVRRSTEREGGFTLIELMVVVLIIGILIAVAIPIYLGSRQRAYNRAAQSDLRTSIVGAKSVYVDIQDYASVLPATLLVMLEDAEPSQSYVAAATNSSSANNYSTSVRVFSYAAIVDPDYSELNMARKSESGDCFYLRDIPEASDVGDIPGDWRGWRSEAVMPNCNGNTVATFGTNAVSFNGW